MIRWAVAGSGNMADLFLKDCNNVGSGKFMAVYSQSQERAEAFAKKHELPLAYSSFSTLLSNPDIDAVYIASTHPNHAPQAIEALTAGKHVLVEKPMSLTLEQAQQVFEVAKTNKCFCTEALWTKFSPVHKALMQQLSSGRIGEVRHINANFGFAVDQSNPEQRLLNPQHAGGALLDIGLYPIFLPLTLFGYPQETQAKVTMGATGVDVASDLIMSYDDGRSATVSYRFDAMMPTKAVFSGTKGWVEVDSPFFAGNALTWSVHGKPTTTEHIALHNRGWGNEFDSANKAITAGQLEAEEHTWGDSLQLATYLNYLRDTWGPTYPFES